MEAHQPPVRIIAPGRCYRRDTPDATALESAIRAAIALKPRGHDFDYSRGVPQGVMPRGMNHTGG